MNSLEKYNLKSIEYIRGVKVLTWQLFSNCNYNCSYCFEHKSDMLKYNLEELKAFSKKLYEFHKFYNLEWLDIFGGEVTLLKSKDLVSLLEPFKEEKNLQINITTNFSRENEYFKEIIDSMSNIKNIWFTTSCHLEHVKLEEFFNKVVNLLDMYSYAKNLRVRINKVVNKNNEEIAYRMFRIVKALKKKYKILSIEFAEEFSWNKEGTITELYDSSSACEKYPEMISNFTQRHEYKFIFKDGTEKIGYNLDILKEYPKYFNTKGCICTYKNLLLLNNILKRECNGQTYTEDFLNCDISKLNLQEPAICPNDFCIEVFKKIENPMS